MPRHKHVRLFIIVVDTPTCHSLNEFSNLWDFIFIASFLQFSCVMNYYIHDIHNTLHIQKIYILALYNSLKHIYVTLKDTV